MIFSETKLKGAYVIELEKKEDERGFFARSWDKEEFEKHGLKSKILQCNVSFNKMKGTLRGMHYQRSPNKEAKLVRCTSGKIFDVIIDLRKNSETFKEWFSVELSQDNSKMIYVPESFAHGFQTLEDNSEVFYQISEEYMPKFSSGIKWNDKTFNIKWPLEPTFMSSKDKGYPNFNF